MLPAISVALTWNVCAVLSELPIPTAVWKTLLSKMTGLEQAKSWQAINAATVPCDAYVI